MSLTSAGNSWTFHGVSATEGLRPLHLFLQWRRKMTLTKKDELLDILAYIRTKIGIVSNPTIKRKCTQAIKILEGN